MDQAQKEHMEMTEYCQSIIDTMIEHPDWTPAIFRAVQEGSELAIDTLQYRLAKYRSAVTAALTLSMSKAGIRNEKIREACMAQVLEVMRGDEHACALDKGFAKRWLLDTLSKDEIEELLNS